MWEKNDTLKSIASDSWNVGKHIDPEEMGFTFDPCNTCITNRLAMDKQHTIKFHVDNLMNSHADAKVNHKFLE